MTKEDVEERLDPKDDSSASFYVGAEDEALTQEATKPKKELKPINWTADDFTTHDKSPTWYGLLILVTVVVTALAYLITKDKITTVSVVVVGVIFGAYAAHKPHAIRYTLSSSGLSVGGKIYGLENFRSISVIDEQKFTTILFIPFKRFRPALTVHCRRDEEEKIVNFLNLELPVDNHGNDTFDRFLRRIHY